MSDYDKTKISDLIAIGLDKSRVTKERGDALEAFMRRCGRREARWIF